MIGDQISVMLVLAKPSIAFLAKILLESVYHAFLQHSYSPVSLEKVKMPGKKAPGLLPSSGVITKVLLHVSYESPIDVDPVFG